MARVVGPWLGWWALAMLLWLALTSTVNASEAIGGVGASCVAATFAEVTRRKASIGFWPRRRWLLRAWRIPVQVLTDTVLVYRALFLHLTRRRRVRGTLRAVPLPHGAPDDARRSARGALVTVGVSMTPNTFVIGIDPEKDEMLVHQLVARPASVPDLLGLT